MFNNYRLKNFLAIVFISFGFIAMSTICKGQYISHFTIKDRIKADTLIDNKTGVKFIIDKKRIFVQAIDKSGKVIWKTDPFIDAKLKEYRVKRPTIIYFAFGNDKTKEKKEVISISYSNTQFGYLDKKKGEFHFRGQD